MMDLAVRWCVLIAVTLNSLTIGPLAVRAGPVSVNFAVSPFGRNIRPISCTSKSGDEGVCMFAMDCTRTNGHHLGTCVDRFYFGSCCGPARQSNSTTTTDFTSSTESTFNGNNDLGQTTISSSTSAAVWLTPSTQQEHQPSNTLGELPTDSTTSMLFSTNTVPVTNSSTSSTTEETSSTPLPVTQSVITSEPTTGTSSTTLEATTTPSTTTVEATTSSSSTTTVEATTSSSTPGSTSSTTTEGIQIDEISPPPTQSPSPPDTTTVKTPSTTLPTPITELTNTEAESPETTEIPSISEESSPEPESTETSFITEETTNWVDVIYTSPEPEIEINTESTSFETDTTDESIQPSSSTTTLTPTEESIQPSSSTTTLAPTETISPIKAPSPSDVPIAPETTTPEPSTASPETTPKPIITTVAPDTTLSPTTSPSTTTTIESNTTAVESTTTSSTTSTSNETTIQSNSTESIWPFPISPVTTTDSTSETTTLVSATGNSSASPTPPSVSWNETSTSVNGTTVQFQDYREVCGRPEYHYPSARIVGGTTTHYGQWPWQVSLRQWRTATFLHKCGAALLNENWAITAAHCVDNVQPDDLLLRMGEYDLATDEEQYPYVERKVQIVASHPQFDSRTFEYDLALLRFYDPVRFQPNIIPICLPEVNPEVDFVGRTAYVTGWGRLYEDGPLPSKMQQVQVPIINNTECENMYRRAGYVEHIPNIFICAGYSDGKRDSCEGDSGGPLVIQDHNIWRLAGVISWGIGCAEANQPGVYTRITEFREWIDKIIVF